MCDYLKEKVGAQPIISYIMYLIIIDLSFSWNTDNFVLVFAKIKCHILFKGIYDATNLVIYHTVTIAKSEKKNFLNSGARFHLELE